MHTFLLQPGIWIGNGIYFDSNNKEFIVEAYTEIIHIENLWINEGTMRLAGAGIEFSNRYEIEPLANNDLTRWTSFNPALGKLVGRFMVVGDTILSAFQSEEGAVSGYESLVKVSDNAYTSRGYALKGSEKLSSWCVELRRR